MVDCPGIQAGGNLRIGVQGCDHNHRNMCGLLVRLHAFEGLHSVHARHLDIQQNKIRLMFLNLLQRILTVYGFKQFVAAVVQCIEENGPVVFVVVNN